MKQNFPKNPSRNRPSLLLWLLPFVLLNFFGETLHNHPIFAGHSLVAHNHPHGARADAQHHQAHQNANAESCLACRWNASSAAHLPSSAVCVASRLVAPPRVLAFDLLRSHLTLAPPNRGPPISFT